MQPSDVASLSMAWLYSAGVAPTGAAATSNATAAHDRIRIGLLRSCPDQPRHFGGLGLDGHQAHGSVATPWRGRLSPVRLPRLGGSSSFEAPVLNGSLGTFGRLDT